MGPKKNRHKPKSSSCHASPSQAPSTSQAPSPSQQPSPSLVLSDALADDAARAIRTLWRGNHEKALRLLEDAMVKHGDSLALMHRAVGCAHAQMASLMADTPKKRRHLQAAVESARRATQIAPHSIEFTLFHATAIYDAASNMADFDSALEECDRGLTIEDPTDPAVDSIEKKTREALGPTKQTRILRVRRQLRDLIHKCNTASATTYINAAIRNTVSLPSIKFSLIPIRRLDPASLPDRKVSSVHKDQVQAIWDTLSEEEQLSFLRPSISDIMAHYGKAQFTRAHEEVLLDVFFNMDGHETCEIWRCFRCLNHVISDLTGFITHVSERHMCEISNGDREADFLEEVDSDWVDKLTNLLLVTGDDEEKTKLFERIQGLFDFLISNESLSVGCAQVVIRFALEEINKLSPENIDALTPENVWLLDELTLEKIVQFLEIVCSFCLLPGLDDTATEGSTCFTEKIWLDTAETSSSSSSTSSSAFVIIEGVERGEILEWVYSDWTCDQALKNWSHMKREKVKRGTSILRALEKQAYLLTCLYSTKEYDRNLGHIAPKDLKLNKRDAMIVGTIMGIRNLRICLAETSYFDLREVLIPFVKSFLQARLEELVNGNFEENSEGSEVVDGNFEDKSEGSEQ